MPEEQELFKAKHRRIQTEPPYTYTADGPEKRRKPKSQLVRDATDTTKTSDPKSTAKRLDRAKADAEVAAKQRETAEVGPEEVAADTSKPAPRTYKATTRAKKGESK